MACEKDSKNSPFATSAAKDREFLRCQLLSTISIFVFGLPPWPLFVLRTRAVDLRFEPRPTDAYVQATKGQSVEKTVLSKFLNL